MLETIGYYGGSFDPITAGHLWVIERALALVDRLVITVANNPRKKGRYTFDAEERRRIIEESIAERFPHLLHRIEVEVLPPNILLVAFAQKAVPPATHLIRGIRDAADSAAEQVLCNFNRRIAPEIDTVLLFTPKELAEVSSSTVKDVFGLEGAIEFLKEHVSTAALQAMQEKLGTPSN